MSNGFAADLEQKYAKLQQDRDEAKELVRKARHLYKIRRKREDAFGAVSLFSDPAWDMLLGLYIDEGERRSTQVSSACSWASAAPTTGLRYVDKLVRLELVERIPDPFDARRHYVSLTRETHHRISQLLSGA